MTSLFSRACLFSLFALLALPFPLSAQETDASAAKPSTSWMFPTTPKPRPDGGKWRIGYYESGDYVEYPLTLQAIAEGLQKLGWVKLPPIPEGLSGEALWRFLAENARGSALEFVGDAYWKPGNFDEKQRPDTMRSFMDHLKTKHGVDLVIAMGTWAGQDMARLGTPIPTVVASTSDPLESGIIESPEDSGQENLHARIHPGRYGHQVRLFHGIIPFRTLGVVYEDSPEGRTYAAVGTIEEVARERGFEIVFCHAPFSGVEISVATQKALECYRKIAPRVDAIYVTTHRGITPVSIRQVADVLRRAQAPSFSMLGSEEVKAGVLMSLAEAKKSYLGLFHAEVIARIFNGAKPRQLNQILPDPAKIALNLKTTRLIGFDPPVDLLLATDEVYEAETRERAPENPQVQKSE
ncbi:MAG: hypothetical protein LBD06_00045 [Candidatus Accumulibacter sp.]|jgi:ABC-type uncharacterized transport system substrate-binding protein|nr:hypothetical protein [Accumulibacter sp.]